LWEPLGVGTWIWLGTTFKEIDQGQNHKFYYDTPLSPEKSTQQGTSANMDQCYQKLINIDEHVQNLDGLVFNLVNNSLQIPKSQF
jgi:hypothetical protein